MSATVDISTSGNSIACVRHGETLWKCEGRTQGQLDSPLTDQGVRQVHALAEKLASESFGSALSSSLGRATQTAAILCRDLRIADWRQSDHIIERYEGAFQGLTRQQQIERFPECFDRPSGQLDPELIPGTESVGDFLRRATAGLREIRRLAATANVLVVTHTGVLQALTSLISGEDFVEASSKRSFGFCEVVRFDSSQIETP